MLRAARNSALIKTFPPTGTVKCDGARLFRSQAARDVGCLLDVNPSVTSWRCMPSPFDIGGDLAPKFYPVLSSLRRFWVAALWAVAAGCGAEPFRLRSTASRRGLMV